MTRSQERSARDGRWLFLLPALAIVFLSSVDLTVIAPILPLILLDLEINPAEADRYVWIASGYLVAYTSSIPLFGRLSDSIGRYRSLLIAAALFVVGSLICATSGGLQTLIIGRIIQGAGGGAMLPVTMALMADLYEEGKRAPMLGLVGAVETIGWVIGPMWGALIEQIAGTWRWVFFVHIPFGVLIGAAMISPARRLAQTTIQRYAFDGISAALVVAGLATLTTGLSIAETATVAEGPRALGAQQHPLDGYRLLFVGTGLALLAAFCLRQVKVASPLIPLHFFKIPQFSGAAIANFGMGVGLMVALVNVPVATAVMVSSDRLSVVTAQLLAGFSLPMAVTALGGGWLSRRSGRVLPVLLGFAMGAAGYFMMSRWPHEIDFAAMLPGLIVGGAGLGLVIAPLADAALAVSGLAHRGISASMVIIMRLLGMTMGISLLSAWAAARVDRELRGIQVPPQVANETLAEYLARQERFVFEQALPITLDILQTTFVIAGVACLLALLPGLLVGGSPKLPPEGAGGDTAPPV